MDLTPVQINLYRGVFFWACWPLSAIVKRSTIQAIHTIKKIIVMDIPTRETTPSAPNTSVLSNLSLRLLTSAVLLPIALIAILSGGWALTVMIGVLATIAVMEFYVFAHGRLAQGSSLTGVPMVICILLAFHFQERVLWTYALLLGAVLTFILETIRHPQDTRRSLWQVGTTLAGVFYVGFPAAFLIGIRAIQPNAQGLMWVLLVCLATWGTDTFAYIGGRFFGRIKLAPILSPKKTLEGAIVGVIGGIIPAYFILLVMHGQPDLPVLILIGLAPIAAVFGDLFESALKRFFHIKDSHIAGLNLLPGHGGVLDRMDSIIWVSTLFYIYLVLNSMAFA